MVKHKQCIGSTQCLTEMESLETNAYTVPLILIVKPLTLIRLDKRLERYSQKVNIYDNKI